MKFICVCFQEKDFEFAGEHRAAYADDEDFVSDQEGSGEIEGSAQGPGNYSPLHLQPQIRMLYKLYGFPRHYFVVFFLVVWDHRLFVVYI